MLSRRDALRGGTAVACVAAIGSAASAADVSTNEAQLLAWQEELHEWEKRELLEEEVDVVSDKMGDLEHRIAETEADTVRGLAVKVRRLVVDSEDGRGAWTKKNARTILRSLDRLAGEAAS